MERIVLFDKTNWRKGAWQVESDLLRWMDTATGYPCTAIRDENSGAWCGYVGVDCNHPMYQAYSADPTYQYVSIHGGVSFTNFLPEQDLWIVPAQRRWWIGFDCMQEFDVSPRKTPPPGDPRFTYRTEIYVQEETTYLAQQLEEMETLND